MTFSVIIPCFNCENTLETTVNSILVSGLSDYEIVLVDDGSTDGTSALCDSLVSKYSAVRCVHQQNSGVSAARNRGIHDARGEYIWFVDSDDTVETLNMESILAAVHDNADCIMFGMRFLHLRHGRTIITEELSCGDKILLSPDNLGAHFSLLFRRNYLSAIWNKFTRRDVLIRNNIRFDPSLINYEDLHFSVLLLPACRNMVALPDVYYNYLNTFGVDRTVERVAKIPDIIAYTDKIVEPFCALDNHLRALACPGIEGLGEIILRLYIEGAWFKLKTANISQLKALCAALRQSENINAALCGGASFSDFDKKLYDMLTADEYFKIRLFKLYYAVRGVAGRTYRLLKSRMEN